MDSKCAARNGGRAAAGSGAPPATVASAFI
jgi:hypothetical protein